MKQLQHMALGLALGLVLAAGGCSDEPVEQLETTAAVPVTVQPARIETLHGTIAVTGIVTPAPGADWTITAPGAGRIAELPKGEGEAVREGDLLVRFEIPSMAADLAAGVAAIAQTTARVASTSAAASRISGLLERGIAARKELEEATRDQAEAEAALAQAQGARHAAATLAGLTVVRARFAGIVARRWHARGDLVDAGAADPVLRVIDPTRLEVVAAVPIGELSRIEPGREARILDPGGGAAEEAVVLTRPAAVDPGRATADIRLTLHEARQFTVGTPVQVEISAEQHEHALVVPAGSIIHEAEATYVMIAGTDDKAHRRDVTLGLVTRELAEVTNGLAAGDRVIVLGHDALPDGATIAVAQ